jgi:hypothetical protein
MYPTGGIRASDAEREVTVAHLQRAVSEGRLTLDEFGERTQRVYASATRGELAAIVADLPIMPSYPVPPMPYPVPPPPPKTSPLPLLALLFGVLGLPTGFPPIGLAGVVLGAISLYKIRRGMPGSRAMALVGLICGSVSVVLMTAFIVLLAVGF